MLRCRISKPQARAAAIQRSQRISTIGTQIVVLFRQGGA